MLPHSPAPWNEIHRGTSEATPNHQKISQIFISKFIDFFVDFGCHMGSKLDQKSIENRTKYVLEATSEKHLKNTHKQKCMLIWGRKYLSGTKNANMWSFNSCLGPNNAFGDRNMFFYRTRCSQSHKSRFLWQISLERQVVPCVFKLFLIFHVF